jgi:hypothetical protein
MKSMNCRNFIKLVSILKKVLVKLILKLPSDQEHIRIDMDTVNSAKIEQCFVKQ